MFSALKLGDSVTIGHKHRKPHAVCQVTELTPDTFTLSNGKLYGIKNGVEKQKRVTKNKTYAHNVIEQARSI